MAASSPGSVSATTARQLLDAAHRGSREILGALDDAPLLVVELGPEDDIEHPPPVGLPCVVVGVAGGRPTRPTPVGVDVALCRSHADVVPPGWVAVPDPRAELERLARRVRDRPQPSVVLAQLLRLSTARDAEAGLVAESLAYSTLQAGPAFAAWQADRGRVETKARAEPDDPVLVERHGDRLAVTLNRPHVRNAVNTRIRDALSDALAIACADRSIIGVELRGAGPDFSSGGDLDEFGSLPDPATAHLARTSRSPARLLAVLGERTTAHLHGWCIGAGVELAAFAGTVLATPDTRLRLPEVDLGLVPGSGGTVSIPRRIGRHRTAWLGLGGAVVDVATAVQWGMVDQIDPA